MRSPAAKIASDALFEIERHFGVMEQFFCNLSP
jgi:hypothetical protein